jgi:tetratricopeptide (TPR) repeat protein
MVATERRARSAEPGPSEFVQAESLYRSGKFAGCVDVTAKAISDGARDESWSALRLKAELALGRYTDAAKTFETALGTFPEAVQLRWIGRDVCRFNDQAERAEKLTQEIADMAKRLPGRFRDPVNRVVLGRAHLSLGVDAKKVLDGLYTPVKKQKPNSIDVYLAIGDLALEKNDYALAADSFEKAAEIDAGEPHAHFGLARAYASGDDEKSKAALAAALTANPNHADSLLFVADDLIDAERYDEAEAALDRIRRTNPEHPLAWAYRAVIAHLRNKPKDEDRCRLTALAHWPANPEVDHLIGKKLSQKYRFAEGSRYQRQALDFDPDYLPAKVQLAQDLLRLGEEGEGWRLAGDAYDQDGYNVVAHNLVTLEDHLGKFQTLKGDGFLVRMDAKEAAIYGARVVDLLERAKTRLCTKYDVAIDEPVIVELFPKQQDFAIRTFGLPGGAGFLGVCFGRVITANSPASQAEHPANWQATLWHEFCHVVTLKKTNHKMPRWLSEGISVYEERQADATWGQRINARYRELMLGDELTPVSQLSAAFLKPRTPLHLQFAYYESSLVVEYLVDEYSFETLKRVLIDLGAGMPINESLARYTGSMAALDAEFAEFARQRANDMAPQADLSPPNLPAEADTATVAVWVAEHPHNYRALAQLAKQRMAEKRWEEAKAPLEEMARLFPEDAGAGNPYGQLATVYRELDQTDQERTTLEKLAALSADDVDAFTRLAELCAGAEDWPALENYATRALAVNPLHRSPYRNLALAADRTRNDALAIEANRALLLLEPIDPAEIHFQLASLLHRAGDLEGAKRHALESLEEAPRYRAAHRELLEIVREIDEKKGNGEASRSVDVNP